MDSFFKELQNTRPFLKMAIEGFAGDGKTFTASLIAMGLHKKIKSNKPIVVYDTERRFRARKQAFDDAGIQVLIRESRSLADLVTLFNKCEHDDTADIILIDSITHVWENFIEEYKFRDEKRPKTRLTFSDWGVLKPEWKKKFSERFQLIPKHIIFTGRAGWEYDYFETDEKTSGGKPKMELQKVGIKMKAEAETEFEPDIVLSMSKERELEGKTNKVVRRKCVVVKDGFDMIDGKEFFDPTFADFEPVINVILSGNYDGAPIEQGAEDFSRYDDEGREKKKTQRQIFLEEIEGAFMQINPGQGAKDKAFKANVYEKVFGTKSWKAIEIMELGRLEDKMRILELFKSQFIAYQEQQNAEGLPIDEKDAFDLLNKIIVGQDSPASSEQSTTGAEGTTEPAAPAPASNRITTEQIVKLSKRIPDKKATEAFQKLIKEKYGVDSINQLSFDAANELIENKKWWE